PFRTPVFKTGAIAILPTLREQIPKMLSDSSSEKKERDRRAWLSMIEQLCQSPEWPESELPIEMKQTHISVLLLSRNYVIKLKKPVDFGFLDYTTIEKRLKACED